MNTPYAVAAAVALATWAVHTFVGGREIARPLIQARLNPVVKYTHYYCWHLVTIVLLAMPVGFVRAAFVPASDLGPLFTVLAAAFAAWNVVLVVSTRQRPLHMPQWALFLPIAVAGGAGWLTS